MEHVKGRRFTEKNKIEGIEVANLARASQAKNTEEMVKQKTFNAKFMYETF